MNDMSSPLDLPHEIITPILQQFHLTIPVLQILKSLILPEIVIRAPHELFLEARFLLDRLFLPLPG